MRKNNAMRNVKNESLRVATFEAITLGDVAAICRAYTLQECRRLTRLGLARLGALRGRLQAVWSENRELAQELAGGVLVCVTGIMMLYLSCLLG